MDLERNCFIFWDGVIIFKGDNAMLLRDNIIFNRDNIILKKDNRDLRDCLEMKNEI
ncbi:MAG: hypothetical protein AABX07_04350 [Nanoarchaeota archaeon]